MKPFLRYIATTLDGKEVYLDEKTSHAATHLADTPGLLGVVKELLGGIKIGDKSNIYVDHNMGRVVGVSDLVETTAEDSIVYAKRPNRTNYARFVRHREPEPTQYVTLVLRKKSNESYELWSAWIGRVTPQFPGDKYETAESKSFWRTHALVWGNQAIEANTERLDWPW